MKKVKKSFFETADGSPTLYMETLNEYYHSKHGALQEAEHVYIQSGLNAWLQNNIDAHKCTVYELGFGTGLNAFLAAQFASKNKLQLEYHSIEAFPLSPTEIATVNYTAQFSSEAASLYSAIINAPWENTEEINTYFHLRKILSRIEACAHFPSYDVLFFDAFGARTQPELWEDTIFEKLLPFLNPNGFFVTYSAKGSVQRVLRKLGLEVALIPGPPGKREMIQAKRIKI